jgi:hypothetical protein
VRTLRKHDGRTNNYDGGRKRTDPRTYPDSSDDSCYKDERGQCNTEYVKGVKKTKQEEGEEEGEEHKVNAKQRSKNK